ncbi:MAG: sulfatase-like hydrolase/transferase [Vicinamibacterales bacterium]
MERVSNVGVVRRWAVLAGALALLNAALTFTNLWPTPMVRWKGDLSVELAAVVLLLALARPRGRVPSQSLLRLGAIVWVILVIGRYADVTVQGLFGREINLYWDSRHFGAVGEMLAAVANPWLVMAIVAAVVLVPVALYLPIRWALGHVTAAMGDAVTRRALRAMAVVALVLGTIQLPRGEEPFAELPQFATPVTPTYIRQARTLSRELSGIARRVIPPAPPVASDFSRVQGADVFLVFLESYGATSWERPEYVEGLAHARARFMRALELSGREVVSAYAESPTFGGSSWLAHVSLLSGTEVRDGDTNMRMMAQTGRTTLLTAFKRHGYRTVALMPGLRTPWPEGQFYGFDAIYGWRDLEYMGPTFGWWDMTDQYVLAKLDAEEASQASRAPLFVFFPTVSTHAPFLPAPPYQPDWSRMLDRRPYPQDILLEAWGQPPDWLNLGPGYVKALAYTYDTLGGYMLWRPERDFVMVVVGDHQPPAVVTGDGASWDVPVHVIASRPALLEQLTRAHGFREGLEPAGPPVSRIDGLMPILLDAFGDAGGAEATLAAD